MAKAYRKPVDPPPPPPVVYVLEMSAFDRLVVMNALYRLRDDATLADSDTSPAASAMYDALKRVV